MDGAIADSTPTSLGARSRRCIVSGEVLPEARLMRFVADPVGEAQLDARLHHR